jgi:hypothetical protein
MSRPGGLLLLQRHPGDREHLDQVMITEGVPRWRRVWPLPASSPRHAEASAWMDACGYAILSLPA